MAQRRCAHAPAPPAETRVALPRWKADPGVTAGIGVAGEGGHRPPSAGGLLGPVSSQGRGWEHHEPGRG